jgi:DNA-binding NtrC family response regulator
MPQERILIVDDEPAVRGIVCILLERSGYETYPGDGGEQALNCLKKDPPYDLILSDIMIPEIDSLGLLDRIGIDGPCTPVVMVAAAHYIHVATDAFRRGAMDYLLKSFDRSQLLAVVTRAIEHGRLRRPSAIYR